LAHYCKGVNFFSKSQQYFLWVLC